MGADIEGVGTDIITIRGVSKLSPVNGHEVMPDRIEAGTFLIASALTQGDILIKKCRFENSGALIGKLLEVGAEVYKVDGGIKVRGSDRIKRVDNTNLPYSGFAMEIAAQMMTLM